MNTDTERLTWIQDNLKRQAQLIDDVTHVTHDVWAWAIAGAGEDLRAIVDAMMGAQSELNKAKLG